MKRIIPLVLAVLITISIPTLLQGQNYAIPWWTIDGGGGISTGGDYSLSGSIGQPDAGGLTGGTYALVGGFWGMGLQQFLFLPLILKN